ncbi:MAG TPA: M56 family metallopeptidase [Gammaproteobacteria bacterium]|nr:M56 family metallopeptidase [Gammaproteobacteria bacterium]
MISSEMVYAAGVALLLAMAALVAERLFAELRWPRRGIWLAALAASVVLPFVSILGSVSSEAPARAIGPEGAAVHEETKSAMPRAAEASDTSARKGTSARIDWASLRRWHSWLDWNAFLLLARVDGLDRLLAALWISASTTLLLAYGLASCWLLRAVKRWPRTRLDGSPVSVSARFGPATLGWLRPRIVVPTWLLEASPATQSIVLLHEREHIAAKDSLLLAGAFLWAALMPWNVALWWQLHRLRLAVEIDCDARVVRGGADAVGYSNVLLAVGRRRALAPFAAVALTERVSQLERRIRLLVETARRRMPVVVLCAAGSMVLSAAAWAVDPAPTAVPKAAPGRVGDSAQMQPITAMTGLSFDGERIVVLVEASGSMLDWTEAGAQRRLSLPDDQRRATAKWRQLVGMTQSVLAQLRPGAQFQVIAFNDEAHTVIDGTEGRWVPATAALRAQAVAELRTRIVPQGASNLQAAFKAASALRPIPDEVFLLVDGLPTAGRLGELAATDQQRLEIFEQLEIFDDAAGAAPQGVPVNVILMPMENEPAAAPAYWVLALRTGGALFAPAIGAAGGRVPGLPLDSEHLVFVVDTSGSMRTYSEQAVRQHMNETLALYPKLKGFQVLNDQGQLLFPGSVEDWIPNVPEQRDRVLQALATWAPFSDSTPYQGLSSALQALDDSHENVAVYVYGDDFARGAIDNAMTAIMDANRIGGTQARKARIHAVAFPVYYGVTGKLLSSANFASLMRELALRNGGSFIGLPLTSLSRKGAGAASR